MAGFGVRCVQPLPSPRQTLQPEPAYGAAQCFGVLGWQHVMGMEKNNMVNILGPKHSLSDLGVPTQATIMSRHGCLLLVKHFPSFCH